MLIIYYRSKIDVTTDDDILKIFMVKTDKDGNRLQLKG